MMKKLILICFLSLWAMLSKAQDFEIVGIEHLPNDFAAREEMKTDHSERQCALMRIATQKITPEQRELFTFKPDLGSELVERATRNGEIWLWVSPGLKYLRIMHRDWGQYELRLMDYVARIESLHTYKIVVKGPEYGPGPKDNTPRQQYLAFQITPVNATLEVDNQIWEVDADGSAMKFVNFGIYRYRVQAKDYHAEEGSVTVDNPNDMHKVNIALRPNFGWVEVAGTGNLYGASVYIDSDFVGKAPCRSERLKSGQHSVRIAKEMYETYSETVTVVDNKTTSLSPTLKSDFAEVTLKVDTDAEIWVNNEKKGTRTWTGRLGSGTYKIECRQNNHETSVTTKEITTAMDGQTILLPSPTPIYGSLNVESSPKFCKLFIDGQAMGETPKFVNEILIGRHEIRLAKDGYADHTETITIAKGERKQVTATLSNGKQVQFTCNVPNAQLEIDGQRVGAANGTYMLTYGSHSLRATAADYRDYTANVSVGQSGSGSYSIQMQSVVRDEETFTVNGVSFTMKLVEGGTFRMGATSEQGNEAGSDEKPVHNVTLSSYYMGETEVTQALWKAVMGTTVSQQRDKADKSWPLRGEGENYPMYYISWNECQQFVTKLNQLTGRNFRLPTEAEWEYAARGGKKSNGYKYAGGNNLDGVAWYTGTTNDNGTKPVKTKSPNELGLYDMSGNVWEWCQDRYSSDYYGKSPSANPQGPSSGSYRVLRGGSWSRNAWGCRVSFRDLYDPISRFDDCGFRLCLPQ